MDKNIDGNLMIYIIKRYLPTLYFSTLQLILRQCSNLNKSIIHPLLVMLRFFFFFFTYCKIRKRKKKRNKFERCQEKQKKRKDSRYTTIGDDQGQLVNH